jgi:hypothetical protein
MLLSLCPHAAMYGHEWAEHEGLGCRIVGALGLSLVVGALGLSLVVGALGLGLVVGALGL